MKDKEKASRFKAWLLEQGISPKVANDLASRCNRLERDLEIDLSIATADEASFRSVMIRIQHYAVSRSASTSVARRTTAALRAAARKYALFEHGTKASSYRYSHGLTKYPRPTP